MKLMSVASSLIAAFVLAACGNSKTYTTDDAVVVKRAEGAVRKDIQTHRSQQQGGNKIQIHTVDCKPVSKTVMECSARVSDPTLPRGRGFVAYRATVDKQTGHVSLYEHPSR